MATIHFSDKEAVLNTTLAKLGFDILTEEFTLKRWKDIINAHGNKNITALLMDQSHISGCGNYIKAEALYYAKVSPLRKAKDLTENEVEKLFEALRIIPRLAYNNKGYSGGEYTDKKGKKGFEEFHLKIYGKPEATKTKTPDGRITHWDPKIQK
jgi:formamidopyrimidine-DNA glycosylase